MPITYTTLSEDQRAQFVKDGWIKVPGGVPVEHTQEWSANAFIRMGWDPKDNTTWTDEAYHMPRHREVKHKVHMPKGYAVACEPFHAFGHSD